jgi:hypothetical protein
MNLSITPEVCRNQPGNLGDMLTSCSPPVETPFGDIREPVENIARWQPSKKHCPGSCGLRRPAKGQLKKHVPVLPRYTQVKATPP